MTDVFAWIFQGGKLVDNAATLGAVSTIAWTVPAGKRWLVLGGYAERDAAATLDLKVENATPLNVLVMPQIGAGTTNIGFGCFGDPSVWGFRPFILDAGYVITIDWGAGQTTPEVALLVMEIDIS